MGHTKAVKDVCFSNDGRRFLSCGYDRQMKLWDTETGQCIKRFSNGKTPYVIKFHPDEDKQNIFMAGMSDKKIIQVRTQTWLMVLSLTLALSMTLIPEKSLKSTISTWDLSIRLHSLMRIDVS